MKYLGSKGRIAKNILPIMQETAEKHGITTWVEPFVGGGNMIDKVPAKYYRVGIDKNPHAIAALLAVRDFVDDLPYDVSEEYYKSLRGREAHPVESLIRFGASFGGKFDGGYARSTNHKGTSRNHWGEARRNAQKQSPKLQGVELRCGSYEDFLGFAGCLVYCDPPYQGTTGYATGRFDHESFWQWCRDISRTAVVFISEYEAPPDFSCVWEGGLKTNFDSNRSNSKTVTEKLFTYRGDNEYFKNN